MKFKSIHKFSVIQETFLVFFNLLRGTGWGRGLCIPAYIWCSYLLPCASRSCFHWL